MSARGLLLVAVLGACSVPELSLDGKQCPCTDGYVCDTLTNRCLLTNGDGGVIDTPAATQCLAIASEAEIYRYTGTFDWQHADASWSGNSTEIHQASSSAQDSYTYKTNSDLTAAPDVHVIASLRQITPGSGSPSLGIALRAQLSAQDKAHFACNYSLKDRQLRIESYSGGSSTVLGAAALAGSLPTSITMEAAIAGDKLACCIRELPDARLTNITAPGGSVTAGYPGLQTNRMEAASGSFVVFKTP